MSYRCDWLSISVGHIPSPFVARCSLKTEVRFFGCGLCSAHPLTSECVGDVGRPVFREWNGSEVTLEMFIKNANP